MNNNRFARISRYTASGVLIVFRSLGRNAAILVSVSSMVIAGLSLYFTINAQRADIEYKEAAILPRLTIGPLGDKLSITVKNSGQGGALIKKIELKTDDGCVSSDRDEEKWIENFSSFVEREGMAFYLSLFASIPGSDAMKINLQANTLQEDDIVRPGEEIPLIWVDDSTLKPLLKRGSEDLLALKVNFAKFGYYAPISITYCSLTGRSCRATGVACIDQK